MEQTTHPYQKDSMDSISNAKYLLNEASNVIILAGAGMSQELGVATYWTGSQNQYAGAMSPYGFTDYEHAQGAMWKTHRAEQIAFYNSTLHGLISTEVTASTSPYKILFDYLNQVNKDYFIMTSNVDSAFKRTGFNPEKIYELHGNRTNSQCLDFPKEHGIFPTDIESGNPTKCPECSWDTRPNCLFFVDFEFNPALNRKQQDIYASYKRTLEDTATVALEIGAGTTIATIRNESLRLNSKQDIPVIRINTHDLHNYGGLKNILPKSKTAPFIALEQTARDGLTLLTSQ